MSFAWKLEASFTCMFSSKKVAIQSIDRIQELHERITDRESRDLAIHVGRILLYAGFVAKRDMKAKQIVAQCK